MRCSAQGRATCRKIRTRLSFEFAPRTFRQKISRQASAAESARPGVRSSHFQPRNKSEAGLRRSLRSGRRNLLPTCWGLGEEQGTMNGANCHREPGALSNRVQQTLPPHPFKTKSFYFLVVGLVKEQWPYNGAALLSPIKGGRRAAPLLNSTQQLNGFQAPWPWQ